MEGSVIVENKLEALRIARVVGPVVYGVDRWFEAGRRSSGRSDSLLGGLREGENGDFPREE